MKQLIPLTLLLIAFSIQAQQQTSDVKPEELTLKDAISYAVSCSAKAKTA